MTRYTRRATIVAGALAVTGCLGGTSRGVAGVAVHNPTDDQREASVTVTDMDGDPLDATVLVPAASTVTLWGRIVMEQTVTATVTTGDTDATTEWDVQGTLYAHLRPSGIEFQRESDLDTNPIVRDDGRVDVIGSTVGAETPIDATIRVGAFEREWTFPADTRVTFHDRVPADGTTQVAVSTERGDRLTESVSLDGLASLVVSLDDELSVDRNEPLTDTD